MNTNTEHRILTGTRPFKNSMKIRCLHTAGVSRCIRVKSGHNFYRASLCRPSTLRVGRPEFIWVA